MTRLQPKDGFELIGVKYDKGMQMVRNGELDGTFYRIGTRVFFIKEKLEIWILNKIAENVKEKTHNLKMISR